MLLEQLRRDCGFSEDGEELYLELKQLLQTPGNLPECARGIVARDRIVFFQQTYGLILTDEELFDVIDEACIFRPDFSCHTQSLTDWLGQQTSLTPEQIEFLNALPPIAAQAVDFLLQHDDTENHLNTAKAVLISYLQLLSSNDPQVMQLLSDMNSAAIGDPLWDIIKEQVVVLLSGLLADLIPGGMVVTLGPQVLEDLQEGNYLSAFWNAVEITLNEADTFIPVAKTASFGLGLMQGSIKLAKFYDAFKKMKMLGDDVTYKVYLTLRDKIDDLYANFEWINNTTGARISNFGDPLDVWDDISGGVSRW